MTTYGANNATPMQEVFDNGLDIGKLNFQYNTWSGKTGGGNFTGGAAMSGGFFAANGVGVPAGDVVAFVQLVTTSAPRAANVWGPQANVAYPDTRVETNPNYPNLSVAAMGANSNVALPQPSVGFTDFPSRAPLAGTAITWSADLLLVLEDPTKNVATVLAGVRWGFGEKPNAAAIGDITPLAPAFFNPALTVDADILNAYFDGKVHNGTTSTKWTFVDPKNVIAPNFGPEPASFVLLASGAGLIAARPEEVGRRGHGRGRGSGGLIAESTRGRADSC